MVEKAKTFNNGRVAISTGITASILFAACWVGTLFDFPASHRFLDLFTTYPTNSWAALAQGVFEAAIGGVAGGFIWSLVYNTTSFVRD